MYVQWYQKGRILSVTSRFYRDGLNVAKQIYLIMTLSGDCHTLSTASELQADCTPGFQLSNFLLEPQEAVLSVHWKYFR